MRCPSLGHHRRSGVHQQKQLYDETIRALTNMKDCGLVAISTPLGPDNFVSSLLNMTKADGTPFYNILRLVPICDKCLKKPTITEQTQCTHAWLPSWKSHGKQVRNQQVGAATGSTNVTAQEDFGLSLPGSNGILLDHKRLDLDFNNKDLNRVFDQEEEGYVPARIYVSFDPNAWTQDFGQRRFAVAFGPLPLPPGTSFTGTSRERCKRKKVFRCTCPGWSCWEPTLATPRPPWTKTP